MSERKERGEGLAGIPVAAPPGPRGPGGGPRWAQGQAVKPKDPRRVLSRLLPFLAAEWPAFVPISLALTAGAAASLAAPRLIGLALDAMTPGSGIDPAPLVLGLSAAYLLDSLMAVVQGRIAAGASQRMVLALRTALFEKLGRLPTASFDMRGRGDMMSRFANDVDNLSTTLSQSAAQLLSTTLSLAGTTAMMLSMSPPLACAALAIVPLVFLVARFVSGRTRRYFKEQQDLLGRLNTQIEESVSGRLALKAFGREAAFAGEFESLNARLSSVGSRAQVWAGAIMPLMNVLNNLGFAAVAVAGGAMAAIAPGLGVTAGLIVSFAAYSRQFARPLNELANVYNSLQTALAGAERVFEVMDEVEEEPDRPDAIDLLEPRGDVEFRDVRFSYKKGSPVLRGVSFKAGPGTVTALVGSTGAGKTTVANLLARFYDPDEGSILIDGVDIRDYRRASLRRRFGAVLQDSSLFAGTVRENLLYGKPGASEAEMRAASRSAMADRFIERLPEAYDTRLGEAGAILSQGQRQLLAIARAFLSSPAILILDEATSDVDTRTELHVQEAMAALMRGRTSFVIAHRLSTIRGADAILVIDGGVVAESGTHDALMARGGIYAGMYAAFR